MGKPKQERRLCVCSIEPYLVGTRLLLFGHTGYPEYVMKSEPLERVEAVVNNIARTADKLPPQLEN